MAHFHIEKIIATLDQKGLLDHDRSANPTVTAKQQRYQFRHDLVALRLMDCIIEFERTSKCCVWRKLYCVEPPALVEEMRTIAAALYKIYHTSGE